MLCWVEASRRIVATLEAMWSMQRLSTLLLIYILWREMNVLTVVDHTEETPDS